ncbi:MAG: helix-turn-helix domain-containing protein [Candidatus Symbiodolus clandestinus]
MMLKMPKRNQHYRPLTQGQRYQIQALHDNGFSQRKVADNIGVNHSTVSRELKRNRFCKRYCAQTAHALKGKRKSLSRKSYILILLMKK